MSFIVRFINAQLKTLITCLSHLYFIQKTVIALIFGCEIKAYILMGRVVGGRRPCLNDDKHAGFFVERRSETLNESALSKYSPNRLGNKLHLFYPKPTNTSFQKIIWVSYKEKSNNIKSTGKGYW